MARFINDDVKLKVGGRKAARITKAELAHLIRKQALKCAPHNNGWGNVDKNWHQDNSQCQLVIYNLMRDNQLYEIDNKYHVDRENIAYLHGKVNGGYQKSEHDMGTPLVGLHTLPNGLTFYGIIMGGDWEYPVFMIIYHDGKKLRSYTPSYGNCVNLDCRSAFGSEGDACDIDCDKLEKKYRKLGVWIEPYIGNGCMQTNYHTLENATDMYLAKYGLTIDTLGYNWDAIKQEIEMRIEMCQTAMTVNVNEQIVVPPAKDLYQARPITPPKPVLEQYPDLPVYIKEFVKKAEENPNKIVLMKVDMGPFGVLTYRFLNELKTDVEVLIEASKLKFHISMVHTAINTRHMTGYEFVIK